MKKFLALLLAALMVFSLVALTACGDTTDEGNDVPDNEEVASGEGENADVEGAPADDTMPKIGVILVGDENEGYTWAHMEGIQKAAAELGIPESNILWKYTIGEDQTCHDAAVDLVENGCDAVFANSYGHQPFMQEAASEYPEVSFVSMTGDTAALSGLDNFSNAFTGVYESRYVSGVVAGLKLAELIAEDKLTEKNYDADGNIRIGYVGAYPYAEVVSGYTAFYLGIKSVVENVAMEVTYTSSWFDITAEGTAAEMLLADGCVIIGQHADSTGAPAAVQAAYENGTTAFSVGYNVSMLEVAPDVALTSASNNWYVYYKFAFEKVIAGEPIPTNWSEGYETGAVRITDLGKAVAEGTAEKVAEVEAAIKDGTLHVFDTATFTVGGQTPDHAFAIDTDGDFVNDDSEAIFDGYYHESYFRSAPSFDLRIDGITELN